MGKQDTYMSHIESLANLNSLKNEKSSEKSKNSQKLALCEPSVAHPNPIFLIVNLIGTKAFKFSHFY